MTGLLSHLDLGRALLALLISLTLYTFVLREEAPPDIGMLEGVPLEITNVPSGLLVLGEDPTRAVQTRVSAPRDMWPGLRPSALRATVDLTRATAGRPHFYPVTVEPPDPRIRVLEIIPLQVSVTLDEIIELPVPVRPNRTGSVPFGYEAGEVEIEPTAVAVSGPATVVRRVEAATVDVRLDGATVDIDGRYRPSPVDSQGQPVTSSETSPIKLSPQAVRVRVPVTQQLSYKTVGIQPSVAGEVEGGYAIAGVTTEPPAVTIVGNPRDLAAVNFARTERIDATDATSTFARQVSIVVPEGVSVVGEGFARVTVRLAAIELTQSLMAVPIPQDIGAGLQLVSALPNVQIVIGGAPTSGGGLQPGDVRATVSLAGRGAGTHQLAVDVGTPAGVSVVSVNPRLISVVLEETTPRAPAPAASPTASPAPSETPPAAP